MKHIFHILFLLVLLSCQTPDRQKSFDIRGLWQSGSILLLVTDSVVTHPFYFTPGFFHYSYDRDSLFVDDQTPDQDSPDFACQIQVLDSSSFKLVFKNDTITYKKASGLTPQKKIKKLSFSAGMGHGWTPVFDLTLFDTGHLEYEGKFDSKIDGNKKFQIDRALIHEINILLDVVDIENYPSTELRPPAGEPAYSLSILFDDGSSVDIQNGLFEGKYQNIIMYFANFESIL